MDQRRNPAAVAGFVLGIFGTGLTLILPPLSIVGFVCSIVGIVLSVNGRHIEPTGLSKAGFVLSVIGTVLSFVVMLLLAAAAGMLLGACVKTLEGFSHLG